MRRQLAGGRGGLYSLCTARRPAQSCGSSLLRLQLSASSALWASRRSVSIAPPPPPFAHQRSAEGTTPAAVATTTAAAASKGSPLFSPQEVRSLVFPFIPCVAAFPESSTDAVVSAFPPGIRSQHLLQQLPSALRKYLDNYRRRAAADGKTPKDIPCRVLYFHTAGMRDKAREEVVAALQRGLEAYIADNFPSEIAVVMPERRLLRRELAAASSDKTAAAPANPAVASVREAAGDSVPQTAATASPPAPSSPLFTGGNAAASPSSPAADPITATTAPPTPPPVSATSRSSEATAPPPPPQPRGRTQRYGGGGGGGPSFFGSAAVPLTGSGSNSGGASASVGAGGTAMAADVNAPDLHTPLGVLDVLVEYVPTYYINVTSIEPTLPSTVQVLYAETSLRFYLKRFRHYIDMRTSHGSTEVRLRPNFDHPKRGMADARFQSASAGELAAAQSFRRPPRNSEANLIGFIGPQVPKEFTPLADVLQEIAPIVSRHPAFDARLGVTGLLAKYPEYFQLVDGKLRARPYREAPNSLQCLDKETSPLPEVYTKVLACVEQAAEGKNYAEAAEKTAAMVSTGRLYSLLTPAEKAVVKQKCRSFPTFLRMHGKDLVVSVDKMRVYKFIPEHEACVDTLMSERLRMNSLDPNDPVLKIPAEMAAESNAEWAVREMYDALPLMQCAELDELLSLVPPAVRDALPKEVADVKAVLEHYEDYFTLWPYPDDENVIVVQRAKVEQPELCKADIVRMVVPLIPQGGTTLTSLRTRAPLQLQRYFYRHGTVATLGAMKDIFAIAGDRIVRLV